MKTNNRQRMSNARLSVVQALYLYDSGDNTADDIMIDFITGQLGGQVIEENPETGEEKFVNIAESDTTLFKKIFKYAVDNQQHIDEVISGSLSSEWPEERLEMVLKAILRAGISEMYKRTEVDAPIIITEYVDIARSFYNQGAEIGLVNAVLDRVSKVVKPPVSQA